VAFADLAILLSWSASGLADFEDSWVVWEGRDGHATDEAEGECGSGEELHLGII